MRYSFSLKQMVYIIMNRYMSTIRHCWRRCSHETVGTVLWWHVVCDMTLRKFSMRRAPAALRIRHNQCGHTVSAQYGRMLLLVEKLEPRPAVLLHCRTAIELKLWQILSHCCADSGSFQPALPGQPGRRLFHGPRCLRPRLYIRACGRGQSATQHCPLARCWNR